jgi:hypothetical protein
LAQELEETFYLESESMKQLRICYTKLIMLDIEEDATKEDIHELIDMIAADEVFIDGEYDDVEWEVM